MVARGRGGAIVTVTSQMGHVGAPRAHRLLRGQARRRGADKAMALELAPHGIRVNTVAPTFVETPMTRPFLADRVRARRSSRGSRSGGWARPRRSPAAVLFAASPGAGLMTGASSCASTADGRRDDRCGLRPGRSRGASTSPTRPANPPWTEVLDGVAARRATLAPSSGRSATCRRRPRRARRAAGCGVTGGFVFEPLHDPARLPATVATARRVAAARWPAPAAATC